MHKLILVLSGLCLSAAALAQSPVRWEYTTQKLDDKTYEIHLTANIEQGWHIYAQQQPKDAIALPTKIKFNKNPLINIQGKINEFGKKETHNIEVLGIQQYQYASKVDFVQKIELKSPVKTSLTGSIAFQVCTDEQCLPAEELHFTVGL
jgi:hypothetical protein